jgi:hypothetical protein
VLIHACDRERLFSDSKCRMVDHHVFFRPRELGAQTAQHIEKDVELFTATVHDTQSITAEATAARSHHVDRSSSPASATVHA